VIEIDRPPNDSIETEDYLLRDYVIKNENGETVASVCCTHLKPGKQTRGHTDEHNEEYFFMGGYGIMLVDRAIYQVHSSGHLTNIRVSKGQFHKVVNLSGHEPLEFISVVPGEVKRLPYPDSDHHEQH
jgi:mannose-6-phosphate isomerase-like protein (cupin superfamily)